MLIPRRIQSRRGLIAQANAYAKLLEAARSARIAASTSTAEVEKRYREKLDRELAAQKARLEQRHEAEMAEAERLNTLALRRADAWRGQARIEAERFRRRLASEAAEAWQERALAAEAALAGARDAALTEAWLAIRAEAGPWPYDLKEALDAVHYLRTGEKLAEAALVRDFDCCTDGHAEAGGTDE